MLDGDPQAIDALPDVIEVKAAGAGELELLLFEFTTEMRAQFDLFRRLRAGAESLLDGADEGLAKQARADIKAATDAIALIVRTLEKSDALLRQLERDRLDAEERLLEARDPEVLRGEVEALIAARVEQAVAERLDAAVAVRMAEVAGLAEGRGPPLAYAEGA
ncbi:hypothetical protein [Rhizobium rhizophilum]|uniref:Uncharacterized protein n=1 Tax=Rhizobium rhizophilum TaxID=1850373 RepID=A0ABY2QUV8_9HYPH|nr:hypothetical protein [Rhizobium rhizophilum]THV14227.1 hypothetical protein E9677_15225 [Rhizobium rhizophilum]